MVQVNQPVSPDPDWVCFSEDVLTMATQCATHWDALAHASYGGVIYNGYPASTVTADGAARCGIHRLGTVVSRGVLLDVARALGRDVLEPGYPIMPGRPRRRLRAGEVAVEPGDIVLVRTGQMVHLRAGSARPRRLHLAVARADRSRRPSGSTRTTSPPWPPTPSSSRSSRASTRTPYLPVHLLHLVEMGMTQGQNWVLDALAEDCAADGRYTFLLDATPLPLTERARLAAQPGRAQVAPVPPRRAPRRHPAPARCAASSPRAAGSRPVGAAPAGHGPVQHAGLGVDEVRGADAPELEAVAVGRHAGEHGHQRARHGHRVGAGRRAGGPARPSLGRGEAVAMTWARATVTALSARTRMPRSCASPSSVARSTTRKTARLSSQ